MKEIKIKPIDTISSFRDTCTTYMHAKNKLPVKGGWGYTKDKAIIIDKNDSVVLDKEAFDGVQLEYELIDVRINLEFIYLQKAEESFRNIYWKVAQQEVHHEGERIFDKLLVSITALSFEAWESRKKEWKENGHKPDFDKDWFHQKTKELTQSCQREFWFDITSFYGS